MRALDPRIVRGMGDQDLRLPPQNFSPGEQYVYLSIFLNLMIYFLALLA